MILTVSPVELLAALGVLLVLILAWRTSVRRARRIATAGRNTARLATLTGRVLIAAGLLGGVQWVVLTNPADPVLTAVVLGLPDLLAAYVLTRAVTVTTVEDRSTARRGDRR